MKKIIIATIVAIVLLAIGLFVWKSRQKSAEPAPVKTLAIETTTFTLDDVAKHASQNDCWMAIEGNVYNVTDFVSTHPGGEAILQGCGKDATGIFNTRPNDGSSHSGRARTMLEKYLVGSLTP